MPFTDLGLGETARAIRDGTLSASELVEACLIRIDALEPALQAWVHVDREGALAAARERDAEARDGRWRGTLHGVPVGVKDIFHVAGLPTRAGSRPFAHSIPSADAPAVARLRAAGAIVLGKTHTTEFAYRDPAPTRNPWNRDHTPGGSSSGSGAAVAARMVPLALGTQTVGSILRPAAYCGVVGLKATHGFVPVDGVIPLAWSLDHVGVLCRSIADAALALGVMAGRGVEPLVTGPPRIALAVELLDHATPELAAHIRDAARRFADARATVTEIRLPGAFADLHAAGQVILEVEAAAYHAPAFARHEADYGKGIAELIRAGLARRATDYVMADRARVAFRTASATVLAAHDALLSPTAPAPAPAGLDWTGDATLCAPWSSAGTPAISLPSELDPSGLPLAIQLVQAPGGEARLLGTAAWCERVLGFTARPGD